MSVLRDLPGRGGGTADTNHGELRGTMEGRAFCAVRKRAFFEFFSVSM